MIYDSKQGDNSICDFMCQKYDYEDTNIQNFHLHFI